MTKIVKRRSYSHPQTSPRP